MLEMIKNFMWIYFAAVALGEIVIILMLKWSEYNED